MSYKLVVVGGQGVGKTAIVNKMLRKAFNPKLESTTQVAEQKIKMKL